MDHSRRAPPWGPGDFTTPLAEVDLRPGGTYHLVMQPPDGAPVHVGGMYREVDPPRRLVYTWQWMSGGPDTWESLVTVEFEDLGSLTRVTVVHSEFDEGSPTAPYESGWQSGLDNLAVFVAETLRPTTSHQEKAVPHAEYRVTINRPAADVFAFLADGETCPEWRNGIIEIRKVSGDGVGAQYKQSVRGPGGRSIAADYAITEFTPNSVLAFEATAGPVRPRGSRSCS